MAKKLVSQQFRERLTTLGASLAEHTRAVDKHFATQEAFLRLRSRELEEAEHSLQATNDAQVELESLLDSLLGGDLESISVQGLKKLCANAGLSGYSRLKKLELVEFVKTNKIKAPYKPVSKLRKNELIAIVEVLLKVHKRI